MPNRLKLFTCLGVIAGVAGVDVSAFGQTAPSPTAPTAASTPAAEAPARPPYPMGMGEILVFGVQPRHIAMVAAVKAGDWAYAAYALKELGETFTRIPRAIPTYQNHNTAEFVGGMVNDPLKALDEAVKAADAKKFKVAYAQLTTACNSCHQATGREAVVIKVPTSAGARADQDFKRSKPPA